MSKRPGTCWICAELSLVLWIVWRQRQVYLSATLASLPAEVTNIVDTATFDRARLYCLDKIHCLMFKYIVSYLMKMLFWRTNLFLKIFRVCFLHSQLLVCALFAVFAAGENPVVALCFDLYITFVIEEKHGFNKQTLRNFLAHQLKSWILYIISFTLIPFMVKKVWLLMSRNIKNKYFICIILWLLFGALTLTFICSYQDIILPMLHSFTVLPDEYVPGVRSLLATVDFPMSRLKVLEASKWSLHSNAFMAGLLTTKVVVLYDTLLKDYSRDGSAQGRGCDKHQVLGVIAHELGHWKSNHIAKIYTTFMIILLTLMLVFARDIEKDFQTEFRRGRLMRRVYELLVYVMPQSLSVLKFGVAWCTHSLEYEADDFAGTLGLAPQLRQGLVKIYSDNLQFPVDDWLFAWCHYSHPTLLQRLQALQKYE